RVRILVPASSTAGTADVVVTNPDGQSVTLKGGYTYLAPVLDPAPSITSISPKEGKLAGGETVDINGDNFKIGAMVKVGGQDAAKIVFVEKTRIRILVPTSSTAGTVDIVVTNLDAQSVTLKDGYTYLAPVPDPAPTITSLSSVSGLVTGGEYILVNGTGFKNNLTATLGGIKATVANYYSATQIRIAIPKASAEGAAELIITNPDAQVASLANAYNYLSLPPTPPPVIKTLSKVTGLTSGGDYVIVTGTDFQKDLTVTLGGIKATVVNYYNATQIRIAIPKVSAEGAAELIITNPDAQVASLANAYTYLPLPPTLPPVIKTLSQVTGLTIGGDYVIVTGTDFQKDLTVTLGGIKATVVNYYSDTQIRIVIPKVTNASVVDLEITNPDGKNTVLNNAYTYTVPVTTITSLSVSTGEFTGGYSTFIYGTNFDPSSVVTINNVPVTIYYYGTTQMKIMAMPSADALGLSNAGGVVTIKVTSSLGNSVTINFNYKAKPAALVPQINKMTGAGGTAATGSITGGTYIYFNGTGFTSTMKVRIYDSSNILVKEEALTNFFQVNDCRQLMPKVTSAGNYTVKLVNIEGTESNGMTYIYK
ncbi:IPT/TIG domain-containing protein, partial [Clostridium gasigenes]|uniref:IPT/TIG domain-containing protein n=1 Tax=Clostridium gasigenes TaxID=94869 RepID=UPI001C0CC726